MRAWAIIGCDDKGVTVEKTGEDPEALADAVASWAQQEEDKWPELGLIYMLIGPEQVPAARALEAEKERCPVCGQPDNCGDCNHTPLSPEERATIEKRAT